MFFKKQMVTLFISLTGHWPVHTGRDFTYTLSVCAWGFTVASKKPSVLEITVSVKHEVICDWLMTVIWQSTVLFSQILENTIKPA